MTIITRRDFLHKSLIGAGLTLAISVLPSGVKLLKAEEAAQAGVSFRPDVWLEVTPENIVNVIVNKSEMGQGVYTSLPMIAADEMEASWGQVRFVSAPAGDAYKDPVWGMQGTGGSTSVRHMDEALRKAGATARMMLISAAAATWGVSVKECEAREGAVHHVRTKRSMTFGELAGKASTLPVPKEPALKKHCTHGFVGNPMPRLDIPEKVAGKAVFGIDAVVPDMLYGAVARPPAFGAKPASYDRDAAMKVAGVRAVIPIDRGIGVCADSIWGAWKGRDALNVKWDGAAVPALDGQWLDKDFARSLEKKGVVAKGSGNAQEALKEAAKMVTAVYSLPYLAHATMEPMNCTAHVRADGCDVWAPTQNQTGVAGLAVKISGLGPEKVSVHTTYLGGGFGRRFEVDVVEEALLLSKGSGRPVKVVWTRDDDIRHDFYRPGNSCRIEAGLDSRGRLTSWRHKVACPSVFSRAMPAMMKGEIDPAAVEGVEDTVYEIPNLMVEYVRVDNPVPVGFWRSVGNSHNAFTMESFMDEMAWSAGKDPLEFRRGLLKNNNRPRRLLEMVAEKAGWGRKQAKGRALGLAQHFSFGTYVATVADVSVNKKDGKITVHKITCCVDCGKVVNPAIIEAQLTGASIMGLSAALGERVEFKDGGASSYNFSDYQLIRMSGVPEVEVHITRSEEPHGGIGEPGLPPVAPAVANAVFTATGARMRMLPMTPENVLAALNEAGKAKGKGRRGNT